MNKSEKSPWLPFPEHTPDNDAHVLFVHPEDGMCLGRFSTNEGFRADWVGYFHEDVTHWMPAPPYEHLFPDQ